MQNFAVARTIKLDTAALEREISSLGLSESLQWELRFRTYEIHQAMRKIDGFTKSWLKGNPQYRAVLYSGPEAAVTKNAADSATNKALHEMILAIEDRIDPKKAGGLNGGTEAMYEHFRPWIQRKVKSEKISSPKELSFDDYRGSLILYGMYYCSLNDATAGGLAKVLLGKYNTTFVQHGPLSAAYGGMLSAFNDVQEKKSSAKTFSTTRRGAGPTIDFSKLTWNPVSRPSTPRDLFVGTLMNTKTGVIKSIKKQGDNVVLYFKTVKYRVPTYKCKDTRRISYIESNGYVHYKQNCVKTGSREVVETNDPVRLPAFAATGLKPNMSMSYIGSKAPRSSKKNKKKPEIQIGWPVAVYKSKKQKKLVALYGVKL